MPRSDSFKTQRSAGARVGGMSEQAAVVIVDTTGTIVGWSPAATDLFGHAASDVLGCDVADVLVPDAFRDAHRRGFAAAIATGRSRITGMGVYLPVRHGDGTVRPVPGRLELLRGPDGDPVGAVATYTRPVVGDVAPFTPVAGRWPTVHRVVANLSVPEPALDAPFWTGILGMETPMDQGWVVNHREGAAQVQLISRDATSPVDSAVSVEVADVDAVHDAVVAAGYEIVHPLTDEVWGVRRFFLRTPGGVVVNVLAHL